MLYEEAGRGEKTLQNGWKRDCDPVTGKVLDSRQVPDAHAPDGKRWHAILRLHGARCGAILQISRQKSFHLDTTAQEASGASTGPCEIVKEGTRGSRTSFRSLSSLLQVPSRNYGRVQEMQPTRRVVWSCFVA